MKKYKHSITIESDPIDGAIDGAFISQPNIESSNQAKCQAENNQVSSHDLNEQVEQLERRIIEQTLGQTSNNKAKAAQQLNISERSLWYKIKKYRLS